jgi:hypothetical protein
LAGKCWNFRIHTLSACSAGALALSSSLISSTEGGDLRKSRTLLAIGESALAVCAVCFVVWNASHHRETKRTGVISLTIAGASVSPPTAPADSASSAPAEHKKVQLGEKHSARDSLNSSAWNFAFETSKYGKGGVISSVLIWPNGRANVPVTLRIFFTFDLTQTEPAFESATNKPIDVSSWTISGNGLTLTIDSGELNENSRIRVTVHS